jgi:hypothetical protein
VLALVLVLRAKLALLAVLLLLRLQASPRSPATHPQVALLPMLLLVVRGRFGLVGSLRLHQQIQVAVASAAAAAAAVGQALLHRP